MGFLANRRFLLVLLGLLLVVISAMILMGMARGTQEEGNPSSSGPSYADHWARVESGWTTLSVGDRAAFCDGWAWMTETEKQTMAEDLSAKVPEDRRGFERVLIRYFDSTCE